MNAKTIAKTKLFPVIAFIFLTSACLPQALLAQEADSVKMISATELNQIMQHEDILLIDVHTPEQQHIKGTDLFIPYDEIEKYRDKFPADKNAAIYLYCKGGPMGSAAAKSLYDLGYRNVHNLEGGAKAWQQSGFAFE